MSMMRDDKAQSGLIIFIIFGLFMMGLIYVLLGVIMDRNQVINNDMINASNSGGLPYTQERRDMMDGLYLYWWSYPLYIIILFIIYGIKKAIDKQSGVI